MCRCLKAHMSDQSLKNCKMGQTFWSIVFIQVVSHNGEMFAFLNQLNNRMDFHWNNWNKFKDKLQPFTCHAFLVKSYRGKSDSGFGFIPDTHLCTFLNANEAKVFNAAYLTKYNKIYEEGTVDDVNELSGVFGTALMDMEGMREQWMDVCEKAALATFSHDVFSTFFGDNPTPLPHAHPWDAELFNTSLYDGVCNPFIYDEDCPVPLQFIQDE